MPLVPCPDCHRPISDAAPACVHCGRPTPLASHSPAHPAAKAGPGPRRHPLAGAAPAAAPSATRAVARGAVVAVVIALIVVRWLRGGGAAGTDDVFSALISGGIGVSLLLSPVPQPSVRTPGARRRGSWGEWFGAQEARRELRWNRVAGWVLVAVGCVYLLLAAV